MLKVEPRTLQGFFDYLPNQMILRQYVKDVWTKIFQKYGFGQLETPALEYADILSGKYGEEEKLIYQFKDRGDREVALRYDQTVPLARVIAQHASEIVFPFKRFEINRVWRADAARKGRKREFYQCDADIVGSKSSLADAEIVALLYEGFNALKLENHMIVINNRKIISGFIRYLNMPQEKEVEVFRSIDKLDKVGLFGVEQELKERGVQVSAISKILDYIKMEEKSPKDVLKEQKNMLKNSDEALEGIQELESVLEYFEMYEIPEKHYVIKPNLVRGLDYYTGIIFEVFSPSFGSAALAGGGRYDKLCGLFSGHDISAVGVAVGFEPLCIALEELGKGPDKGSGLKALVTVFSEEYLKNSVETVKFLRKNGIAAEIYLEKGEKLGKQFQYADRKGIPFAIVIGEDEVAKNGVMVKDMKKGEQKFCKKEELAKMLCTC